MAGGPVPRTGVPPCGGRRRAARRATVLRFLLRGYRPACPACERRHRMDGHARMGSRQRPRVGQRRGGACGRAVLALRRRGVDPVVSGALPCEPALMNAVTAPSDFKRTARRLLAVWLALLLLLAASAGSAYL